jgi:hypothetical protein
VATSTQFLKISEAIRAKKGKVIKRQKQVESLLNSVKDIKKLSLIALGASIG